MPRKNRNWSKWRKIVQGLSLLGWLALWVTTSGLVWEAKIGSLPAHADPLLMLAYAIANRTLLLVMLPGIVLLAISLLFGRVWCGWICPVGTVLDIFPLNPKNSAKPKTPQTWRMGKYLTLTAVLVAALFGNLSLLILDPVAIWERTLTGGVGPALNIGFTAMEEALEGISWLGGPLTWLDGFLRPAVFPTQAVGSRLIWLPVVLFVILVLLNLVAERFWCRNLCPLGGMYGLISKLSIFKRRVTRECTTCNQCAQVCPTGTIDPARGYASDYSECVLCMNCISVCPANATRFEPWPHLEERMPYDPGRRQVLITGALTLAGLTLIDPQKEGRRNGNFLLRPPGAQNEALLETCLRCGICMRTCPTGALQSSLMESGLIGMFTPVLIPRLGYCLYSCNKCGQVCPVGAIPPLDLAEKQRSVIGRAFIDQTRCIPWADGTTCFVCEEMCPLPEKAIVLEERSVTYAGGSEMLVKLPFVLRERCIGCGICEYKCPRSGESAIRVFRADI